MNHAQARELLHDYVDNDLAAGDRRQLELHLSGCQVCREEIAYLLELQERAISLRRPVAPPHDLWPGIAAAIDRSEVPGAVGATRATETAGAGRRDAARRVLGLPITPANLAAAAVAAGILLGATALWRAGPEVARWAPAERTATATRLAHAPVDLGVTNASATVQALAAVTRPDTRERLAFAVLTGQSAFGQSAVGPGREALGYGVAQLDQVIDELTTAWLDDPGNARLAHQLATAYQNRALLQRRADRLSVQL